MLEDKAWLDNVTNRKPRLMAENYRIATSFFPEHGIRVCESITDIRPKNRVMIALGSVYMPKELGLFRITFIPGTEALGKGLERLLSSIAEAEAEIHGK
ncbi:aspartate aminotransferase [Aspergillus luchuensis]|uniref:Aspartate aminotransferase n=1 Tax=Aspergillus kawachii TaxID=1069201 RepID=A0A146EX09_ASPKA|nr:aspartate aminotransferase [Aspergillus luchuensis]